MIYYKMIFAACLLFALPYISIAQIPNPDAPPPDQPPSTQDTESERWNLYFQSTSIGDYHGTFRSPYEGPLSLSPPRYFSRCAWNKTRS
jgi:hypothetical protein